MLIGLKINIVSELSEKKQKRGRVCIYYCTRCRFVLRATWVAQELLFTFQDTLIEVTLCPADSGRFEVWLDKEKIFSREEQGRFPEMKELRQRIRDCIDPGRDLGHSDVLHK